MKKTNADIVYNVFGKVMQPCCYTPLTGYFRDGFCRTIEEDSGTHIICAVMSKDFLEYTKSKGNDLSTPIPQYQFPGLVPGDKWCLCISRWLQAHKAGKAPQILLEATHQKALEYTSLELLKSYAYIEN